MEMRWWLPALLREGRDATAVAGEDGSCANGGRWWRCHGVDGASWWPEEVLRWCVKVADGDGGGGCRGGWKGN